MNRDDRNIEETLLDWHLERLDDDARAWVEQELRRDAQLRAQSDRIGMVLQPLDHWRVSAAPSDLADKVMAYIDKADSVGAEPLMFPTEAAPIGRRFPFALREVVAAAACILLLIGVFVPGAAELRERSRRAMCAGNLGSIFRGVSAYRQAFAGALPFAGNVPGSSWLPGGATDGPFQSNSRHTYLLVKLNYVPTPDHFACGSSESELREVSTDLASSDDFSGVRGVRFATMNLAGGRPNLRPTGAVAYISDANPLFVNARFDSGIDPYKTNSPSHSGRGQNVLTLDGSATWMPKPVYGPKHDNLWLIGNVRNYSGTELPQPGDVQLVPGFAARELD